MKIMGSHPEKIGTGLLRGIANALGAKGELAIRFRQSGAIIHGANAVFATTFAQTEACGGSVTVNQERKELSKFVA